MKCVSRDNDVETLITVEKPKVIERCLRKFNLLGRYEEFVSDVIELSWMKNEEKFLQKSPAHSEENLMSQLYVDSNGSRLQDTAQFSDGFKRFLNWHFFYDDYNWRKAFTVVDFGVVLPSLARSRSFPRGNLSWKLTLFTVDGCCLVQLWGLENRKSWMESNFPRFKKVKFQQFYYFKSRKISLDKFLIS